MNSLRKQRLILILRFMTVFLAVIFIGINSATVIINNIISWLVTDNLFMKCIYVTASLVILIIALFFIVLAFAWFNKTYIKLSKINKSIKVTKHTKNINK